MGLVFWWRSEVITSLLWVTHTIYRSILTEGIDLRSLPPEIVPFGVLVPLLGVGLTFNPGAFAPEKSSHQNLCRHRRES